MATARRIRHTCFAGLKQRRQPGGTGGQGQRCFERRAAALEDVKRERVHPFHQQPQTGRRSIVARIQAAKDEQQPPLLLGGHVQAPQLGAFGLGQPGQDGRHFGAAQRLFGGPQPGGGLFRAHAQQPLGRQALRLQAGPEGLMRCAHQDHRPRLPGDRLRQRRQQQLPDMLPGPLLQDLHHAAHRPAAAGQLRIQGCMAGGQHRSFSRKIFHPPDIGQ